MSTPSGFNNKPNDNLAGNLATNISGIFSTRQTAKYASGARTLLKVNNKLCGFAFGVSWRINTAVTEVQTIDDYFAYELVPQRITVEGTISALHIPGQSAGTELWQSDAVNFLFQQYITIEVRDTSDNLLFYTNKAMITTRQEDIRVDQLANVTLSFRAIGFQDERAPSLADGANVLSSNGSRPQTGPSNPVSRLKEQVTNIANSVRDRFRF
jgi:hypothetical protein